MGGSEGLVVDVTQSGVRVALRGALDVHGAADARLALHAAAGEGSGDLLVDLSQTTWVDSTGLGVLLGAHRRAGRAGRRLVLLDPPPSLGRVLRATRLDRVLVVRGAAQAA